MAKKTKTLGVNLPVPQSREAAAQALHEIGLAHREVARLEADLNDAISTLKADAEQAAQPLRDKAQALTDGLKTWAEANRDAITQGGRVKFAELGTGKISWRLRPPAVRITGVEKVIEAIRTLGLNGFLRVKTEINKDALAADPDKARLIAGVTIASAGEDFVVEPFETEIAKGVAA